MRKQALLLLVVATLAGCAAARTAPGTGWSRAPDLAVYEAMSDYALLARERDVLCAGFARDRVHRKWQERFGARHDWIEATLIHRYGHHAVAAAAGGTPPTVECGSPFENDWRVSYARLLRLLETRLYPAGYLG